LKSITFDYFKSFGFEIKKQTSSFLKLASNSSQIILKIVRNEENKRIAHVQFKGDTVWDKAKINRYSNLLAQSKLLQGQEPEIESASDENSKEQDEININTRKENSQTKENETKEIKDTTEVKSTENETLITETKEKI